MDTETKLAVTPKQAQQLAEGLAEAARDADRYGKPVPVRIVLEQMTSTGPWRLVLIVHPSEA